MTEKREYNKVNEDRKEERKEEIRHKLYLVNAILCLSVLVYFAVASILMPKPEVSEVENRELAKAPKFTVSSLFAKDYTRGFDEYYADTFPFREWFIETSFKIDALKGKQGNIKLYETTAQDPNAMPQQNDPASEPEVLTPEVSVPELPQSSQPPESSTGEAVQPPQPEPEPDVTGAGHVSEGILIIDGAAYQGFYGSDRSGTAFANLVSSYAADLPGVNVYTQIIPQPYNFLLPQKYWRGALDEKVYIDKVYSQLTNGARGIPVYDKLEEDKEEYIYFRTDTHWTARGAYSAYRAFCETAGFSAKDLSEFEKRQAPNPFLGYLYTITKDKSLEQKPDYIDYYIVPGVTKVEALFTRDGKTRTIDTHFTQLNSIWSEGTNNYSLFIYGDLPYMKISTNAGTGRDVLIIKDSYGNAFVPYLVSHYDTVHVIDERHFPYSVYDLVSREGIEDLIISQSDFSANAGSHQANIEQLKYGLKGNAPDFYAPYVAPQPEVTEPQGAESLENE